MFRGGSRDGVSPIGGGRRPRGGRGRRSMTGPVLGVLFVAVLAVAGGCASTSGASTGGGDRELLTRADLEPLEHLNAYDAIRRLKPAWLRMGRGAGSIDAGMQARRGVQVYVDGAPHGFADQLKQIAVRDVREIRHLAPRDATIRFGTDHTEGAILVTTRRGPGPGDR